MRFKDGKTHDLLWSADSFESEGEDCLISVLIDITDFKKLQEENLKLEAQLQQSQKMEAIGTLAGGIAHDFNNILSAVIGYTDIALIDIKPDTSLYGNLQEVLRAGNRAKDLVKQILTFSRQTEHELKPFQANIIVKEALKFLRASLPATIELQQNIQSDSLLLGDPTQLHQVLMNLCTNASHAMQEEGGLMEIRLVNEELVSPLKHYDLKPGKYVKLTVRDTGHGMTPDILEKIFDPFYTTKDVGEGTGMGLSVVHGIVVSHGGAIFASSEPGKGSIFNVYFPAIEKRLDPEAAMEDPLPNGTEHILFVDDEKVLVEIGEQMLEKLGFKVDTRTCPYEALEAFKANPDKYDMVITDMTMPKLTGENLAHEILLTRSDIPIIICTGFSNMMNSEKANAMGIKGFLTKPLTMSDLSKNIRNILDQS